MKLYAYSILDVKSKAFGSPYYANCDEIAVRNCAALVQDPGQGGMLARYPEDFVLYRVGFFDDDTGVLSGSVPEVVVQLLSLKGVDSHA